MRRPITGVLVALMLISGVAAVDAKRRPVSIRCAPGDLVYTRIGHGPVHHDHFGDPLSAVRAFNLEDYSAMGEVQPVAITVGEGSVRLAHFNELDPVAYWDVAWEHGTWLVQRFTACNQLLGGNRASAAAEQEDDPASEYYETKWTGKALDIEWRFTDEFPTGRMRTLAVKAAATWNALGESLQFAFDPEAEDWEAYPISSCPGNQEKGRNGIHWGTLGDGGAYTIACTYTNADGTASGRMHSFQIKFADNTNWYTGSKQPRYGQEDFLSYAVHEFGHATGRIAGGDGNGHFPDGNAQLCASKAKVHHTMCQTAPNGATFDRSLNERDRSEFTASY